MVLERSAPVLLPTPHRATRVGNYELTDTVLGKGSYSKVYKAFDCSNGKPVAVKVIKKALLRVESELDLEIDLLKNTQHPNIVRLLHEERDATNIYLVLEFCESDFAGYLSQRGKKIPEEEAKYFFRQIANGLQFLRDRNIIHRDLKPKNLLVCVSDTPSNQSALLNSCSSGDSDSDGELSTRCFLLPAYERYTLRITDFGYARYLQENDLAASILGTPLYMSPEILQRGQYNEKADLWAVGVILYECVTGERPFIGPSFEAMYGVVKHNVDSGAMRDAVMNANVSAECADLILRLLEIDQAKRLSFEEFMKHPFLCESSNTTPLDDSLLFSSICLDEDNSAIAATLNNDTNTGTNKEVLYTRRIEDSEYVILNENTADDQQQQQQQPQSTETKQETLKQEPKVEEQPVVVEKVHSKTGYVANSVVQHFVKINEVGLYTLKVKNTTPPFVLFQDAPPFSVYASISNNANRIMYEFKPTDGIALPEAATTDTTNKEQQTPTNESASSVNASSKSAVDSEGCTAKEALLEKGQLYEVQFKVNEKMLANTDGLNCYVDLSKANDTSSSSRFSLNNWVTRDPSFELTVLKAPLQRKKKR